MLALVILTAVASRLVPATPNTNDEVCGLNWKVATCLQAGPFIAEFVADPEVAAQKYRDELVYIHVRLGMTGLNDTGALTAVMIDPHSQGQSESRIGCRDLPQADVDAWTVEHDHWSIVISGRSRTHYMADRAHTELMKHVCEMMAR
ncbi:MAG: hypothetical protein LBV30_08060 [Propionibacteriaceae bacterium]|nr:hypothetical protein [Propionibacteriaceae bacterium]